MRDAAQEGPLHASSVLRRACTWLRVARLSQPSSAARLSSTASCTAFAISRVSFVRRVRGGSELESRVRGLRVVGGGCGQDGSRKANSCCAIGGCIYTRVRVTPGFSLYISNSIVSTRAPLVLERIYRYDTIG